MSNVPWQNEAMNEIKNNCCSGKRRWLKTLCVGRIRLMKCSKAESDAPAKVETATLTNTSALLMMN
jgi:hypothetical protein